MRRLALRIGMGVCLLWLFPACCSEGNGTETGESPAEVAPTPPQQAVAGEGTEYDKEHLQLVVNAEPESGRAPLTVRFSVEWLGEHTVTNPKYTWVFGDTSQASTEASPKHTYKQPGEYIVTVRIIDEAGLKGWDEVDIQVNPPLNP